MGRWCGSYRPSEVRVLVPDKVGDLVVQRIKLFMRAVGGRGPNRKL